MRRLTKDVGSVCVCVCVCVRVHVIHMHYQNMEIKREHVPTKAFENVSQMHEKFSNTFLSIFMLKYTGLYKLLEYWNKTFHVD